MLRVHFLRFGLSFLLRRGLPDWGRLPLWLPSSDETMAGFYRVNSDRAYREGLTSTPIESIVQATLSWSRSRPDEHEWKHGLAAEEESELIESWLRLS